MLLSKEIRDLILTTSKIMNKFIIVFKSDINQDEISHFLTKYGKFMKVIKFKDETEINSEDLVYILSQVPNLEELLCEDSSRNHKSQPEHYGNNLKKSCLPLFFWQCFKYPFQSDSVEFIRGNIFGLPKLSKLTIMNENLIHVLKNVENIKNLEKLTIYSFEDNDDEFLTNFVVQQDSLKELSLINREDSVSKRFPSRDISNEVKFNLTKLEYHFGYCEEFDNFLSFFKIQAENLTELKVDGSVNYEIIETIVRNCKKVESLGLMIEDDHFIMNVNKIPGWIMENVKYFKTVSAYQWELRIISWKFPNLKTLNCYFMINVIGELDDLITLETRCFSCAKNSRSYFSFKNLENFITGIITNKDLEEFLASAPNLRHFTLKKFCVQDGEWPDFLLMIKRLKSEENIETLKIYFESYFEIFVVKTVLVDNVQRTVQFTKKSSDSEYNTFSDNLKEIFEGYTFSNI